MNDDKLYTQVKAALDAGIYTKSEEKAARELLRKLDAKPRKPEGYLP